MSEEKQQESQEWSDELEKEYQEWLDAERHKIIARAKERGMTWEPKHEEEFKEFLKSHKYTRKEVEPETELHDWMRFIHDMQYYYPGDEAPESLQDVFERREIMKKTFEDYKAFLETPEGSKDFWEHEKYLEEHPEERPGPGLSIQITMISIDKEDD